MNWFKRRDNSSPEETIRVKTVDYDDNVASNAYTGRLYERRPIKEVVQALVDQSDLRFVPKPFVIEGYTKAKKKPE